MSAAQSREDSQGSSDAYRSLYADARTEYNGETYDDRYSRDRSCPNSPSPRRYTPPHDRSRTPPRGTPSGWKDKARDRDLRHENQESGGRGQSNSQHRNGGYRDRDREDYRSPGYDSQSRSRSPRRNRSPDYGGPPSREIMMDGLPVDMDEEDVGHTSLHMNPMMPQSPFLSLSLENKLISKELAQYHNVEGLEDVRVIRDRQTKIPRGFGFLRFPTIDKAKAFLEPNYPTIYLYGNNSSERDDSAAKVRVAFSRERGGQIRGEKPEGDWICMICTFANFPGRKICFKCQSPQIDFASFGHSAPAKPSEFLNSGDSDASPDGSPSQFLLIRSLEPTVTEDLLAKGVAKLYKPGGMTTQSNTALRKGAAKVASTTGDANLGAKDGSLRRILLVRDRRTNESWRYGFAEFASVEDAQAALIRFNSFEKFTISSKPVKACYIHAGVFVPVSNSSEINIRFMFSPLFNSATKLQYWDEEAYVSELEVSRAAEDKPINITENRATDTANKAAAAEKEGLITLGKETDAKAKKRKAEAKDSAKVKKTVPAHLQFWSNRHAELHGTKPAIGVDIGGNDFVDSKPPAESKTTESKITPTRSFANLSKKCCYLCSRQFKTEVEVNKHERLSQLHRDNLQDDDLKGKALAKMEKAGIDVSTAEEDTSEYRDRAKERRAAFGVGKKISLSMTKTNSSTTPDEEISNTPLPSKGASLLGKMGWAAGEGLGAQGTGMTAPIATEMYVAGVGLGAQGGKVGDAAEEAEKNTKGGYGGFLERTKNKAKERFERME